MELPSNKKIRNNIKYVIFLSITILFREIISEMMRLCYGDEMPPIFTTLLMFGGEFFFGLIYFIIKCKTTFKKEEPKFKGIPLIIGVEKKKIVLLKLIF